MFNAVKISVNHFRRDEDGSVPIFGLVMMGGFAVDLMRYENTRTNLQNTLDRLTLAAAALSQNLDREAVVRDCMRKAGIGDQLQSVTATTSPNSSVVKAVGRADTCVARQFYARALGSTNSTRNSVYNNTMNSMRGTYANVANMDATLDQTCDLAKAQGVIVYGVPADL